MESTGTSVAAAAAVAVAGAAPAVTMAPANTSTSDAAPNATTEAATAVENKSFTPEFDPCIPEEERRFYLKAYPSVDLVRERRVHCTVCKAHIGTAPNQEHNIKMHPVLRVTHCIKCHDFYNSGEFSKGEDGSELYCRWCGQGGEVYCCSSCPYVFCKSCIVKNLSKGVVADIEQNENWNCFSCAPKILWPLRALHWALVNFIEKQKISFQSGNYSEADLRVQMAKDRSTCCRLAKAKCGNMSDSLESLDSVASRRSQSSSGSTKKKLPVMQYPNAKRPKTSNDEVVCTPDLLSMLEPDCQITVSSNKSRPSSGPITTSPKVISLQSGYGSQPSTPKNNTPPPLVLRNTGIPMRHHSPMPVVRRTVVGPRTPTPAGSNTPVYHTINGYRIDLNTAAQQETFRLPNGKLIQVKRQGAQQHSNSNSPNNSWQQQLQQRSAISIHQSQQLNRSVQITQNSPQQFVSIPQSPSVISGNHTQQQQHPHIMRYQNAMVGSTSVTPLNQSSGNPQMHVLNGATVAPTAATATVRTPIIVRHVFPDTAIGQARSQLQDQVFNAMEICQHLTGKIQTLTNSNAYKQARNYLEVKELYIHLSYLLTYAIGRFKGLQDKCLGDMRQLGFVNDADSLENGQLAADKQASDDEDIEIVEPKTDTITLDSDNEDEPSAEQNNLNAAPVAKPNSTAPLVIINKAASNAMMKTAGNATTLRSGIDSTTEKRIDVEFMSNTHAILSSMFEIEMVEDQQNQVQATSPTGADGTQKKQPRKKMTSKPNPTLIKQKEMLERERLDEMKRNDLKLKMKCAIELKKAEEEYPFAKNMLTEELEKGDVMKNGQNVRGTTEDAGDQNANKKGANDAGESSKIPADSLNTSEEVEEIELLLVDDMDSSVEAEGEEENEVKEKNDKEEDGKMSEDNIKTSRENETVRSDLLEEIEKIVEQSDEVTEDVNSKKEDENSTSEEKQDKDEEEIEEVEEFIALQKDDIKKDDGKCKEQVEELKAIAMPLSPPKRPEKQDTAIKGNDKESGEIKNVEGVHESATSEEERPKSSEDNPKECPEIEKDEDVIKIRSADTTIEEKDKTTPPPISNENDENEIDVNKEIAKILQRNLEDESERTKQSQTGQQSKKVLDTAEEKPKAPPATQPPPEKNDSDLLVSTELFNDINELIDKENNTVT